MNIDDLTIGQARQLAALFPQAQPQCQAQSQDFGFKIAVLDRGFVYVGNCRRVGDILHIDGARNIRYWGTERGLHQLALEGPTGKTKLDHPANVQVSWRAVISLHETEIGKWSS